jgi:hypothetical protein
MPKMMADDLTAGEIASAVKMAWEAAKELQETGDKKTNVKLACWGAALSVQQSLHTNGLMLRALVKADYVKRPLPPDWQSVKALFDGMAAMYNEKKHHALLYTEELYNRGLLDFLANVPDTLSAQREQRAQAMRLLAGHGFGWKALSMVPLIIRSTACQVIPLDRHHLARICAPGDGSAPKEMEKYQALEDIIKAERDGAGYAEAPLGVWAWALWETYRKRYPKSSKADSEHAESHKNLSCRLY